MVDFSVSSALLVRLVCRWNAVIQALELTWVALKPNMHWLAIFGLITHPLYMFINNALGNGTDSLALRMASVIACAVAITLPKFERAYGVKTTSFLAISLVFFTLPFFFIWILVENALNANLGPAELAPRQIQCALAVMATALLIYDRATLIIGLLISIVLVAVCFASRIYDGGWASLASGVFTQLPFWFFGVIAGTYFNRNRAVVEREKIKTLFDTGGYLAHELRTPLAGASLKLHGVRRLLDEGNSRKINPLSVAVGKTESGDFSRVDSLCVGAIDDVIYANSLIDMFLVRAGFTSAQRETDTKFHASAVAREALQRYTFSSDREKQYTRIDVVDDFRLEGPFVLLTHVILNLLKNALAYVPSSLAPEVVIRISRHRDEGRIEVSDNGVGIPKADQAKIFDSFFTTSTSGEGAGIGLNFCQKVVSGIGGSIAVRSQSGIETTFTLRLRRLADTEPPPEVGRWVPPKLLG